MKPLSLGAFGAVTLIAALPLASGASAAPQSALHGHEQPSLVEATYVQGDATLVPAAWRYRWVRERVYVHHRHFRHYRRYYTYGYRYYGPVAPYYAYPYYRHYYWHRHHNHFYRW